MKQILRRITGYFHSNKTPRGFVEGIDLGDLDESGVDQVYMAQLNMQLRVNEFNQSLEAIHTRLPTVMESSVLLVAAVSSISGNLKIEG